MKKKYRDIAVNGETYGWIVNYVDIEDRDLGFSIYKNKKYLFSSRSKESSITPSLVARCIENHLAKTK